MLGIFRTLPRASASDIWLSTKNSEGGSEMYYDIKKSGQRIRQLRERRKETQETLSEKLNISLSLLRKIETGRRGTSIEVLIVFGTSTTGYRNICIYSV